MTWLIQVVLAFLGTLGALFLFGCTPNIQTELSQSVAMVMQKITQDTKLEETILEATGDLHDPSLVGEACLCARTEFKLDGTHAEVDARGRGTGTGMLPKEARDLVARLLEQCTAGNPESCTQALDIMKTFGLGGATAEAPEE
jgi:hypothetical protein